MKYKAKFCICGEPLDNYEKICILCEISYEGKYDPVAEYAIRGYIDGIFILEDGDGVFLEVNKEDFINLENNDKVWYSFKGAIDFSSKYKEEKNETINS